MKDATQTSFRLSREAMLMLRDLSKMDGVSMTAVLELLIREKARKVTAKSRKAKR